MSIELFDLIRKMPSRYRVLDLATDHIWRYVEGEWVKVGTVLRTEADMGEHLIKLPPGTMGVAARKEASPEPETAPVLGPPSTPAQARRKKVTA